MKVFHSIFVEIPSQHIVSTTIKTLLGMSGHIDSMSAVKNYKVNSIVFIILLAKV